MPTIISIRARLKKFPNNPFKGNFQTFFPFSGAHLINNNSNINLLNIFSKFLLKILFVNIKKNCHYWNGSFIPDNI